MLCSRVCCSGRAFLFLWCCLYLQPFFPVFVSTPVSGSAPGVSRFALSLMLPTSAVTQPARRGGAGCRESRISPGWDAFGLVCCEFAPWAAQRGTARSVWGMSTSLQGAAALKLPFPRGAPSFAEDVRWDGTEVTIVLLQQSKKCPHMDQHFSRSRFTGVPPVQEPLLAWQG